MAVVADSQAATSRVSPVRSRSEDDPQAEPGTPPRTCYRTIFLSDIHLGTKGCKAHLLLDFLDRHQCERLYLVGDIVDGWRLKSTLYWPQDHANVLRRFLTLARGNTEVIYITGNHDEFLRRYSDLEVGNIRLVDEAIHETADGRRLLVIHGDQFDVVTRHYRWLAFLGDLSYVMLLEINRWYNLARQRLGFGYWSLSAWLKHQVKHAVSFFSGFEDAVARECQRRNYDGAVCGHIHRARIDDIDGIRYHNCGDWVESCTALVENAQGEFTLLEWAQTGHPVVRAEPVEPVLDVLREESRGVTGRPDTAA